MKLTASELRERAESTPGPIYVPMMKMVCKPDTVRFSVIVSTEGTIKELTQTAGPECLGALSRPFLMLWKYKPLTVDGEAVEIVSEIELTFK